MPPLCAADAARVDPDAQGTNPHLFAGGVAVLTSYVLESWWLKFIGTCPACSSFPVVVPQ